VDIKEMNDGTLAIERIVKALASVAGEVVYARPETAGAAAAIQRRALELFVPCALFLHFAYVSTAVFPEASFALVVGHAVIGTATVCLALKTSDLLAEWARTMAYRIALLAVVVAVNFAVCALALHVRSTLGRILYDYSVREGGVVLDEMHVVANGCESLFVHCSAAIIMGSITYKVLDFAWKAAQLAYRAAKAIASAANRAAAKNRSRKTK
jgi:hypothetical protein